MASKQRLSILEVSIVKNKKDQKIFVQVLQNGEVLSEISKPFHKLGIITLSSSPSAELTAPYYPLSHDIQLIRITKRGAELDLPPNWVGYTTSNGKLENFATDRKNSYTHIMKNGDYGSLALNDLQILIRIGRERKSSQKKVALDRKYRGSVLTLLFPTSDEIKSFGIAVGLSAFIVGCIVAGLLMRPRSSEKIFLNLSNEYTLPFIHPNHLKYHPEALQEKLDRNRPLFSTMEFVKSFTALISGFPVSNPNLIFPSTLSLYKSLFKKKDTIVETKTRIKIIKSNKLLEDHTYGVISVPTVTGESVAGTILRLKDKFEILHENFRINHELRTEFLKTFRKDPVYEYGRYKNIAKKDLYVTDMSKINMFSLLTNEEAMYKKAMDLGREAQYYSNQIKRFRDPVQTLTKENSTPIAITGDDKNLTFVHLEKLDDINLNLKKINGSAFSDRKNQVREPLIGRIDSKLITGAITQNKFQLQLCFELALRRNKTINGSMEWQWTLDSRGKIFDISLLSSSITDRQMIRCVRQKIAKWRFPRPKRGSIEITYPFHFTPAKG